MGRRERVGIEGMLSPGSSVLSGVTQGSVLGTILFICYIDDMPEEIKSFIHIYADDTNVFQQVNSIIDRDKLQKDIDKLDNWSKAWHINVRN